MFLNLYLLIFSLISVKEQFIRPFFFPVVPNFVVLRCLIHRKSNFVLIIIKRNCKMYCYLFCDN